ncbi:SAM-dependent methyltransferase [Candidatus Roizmanbacteria bacterium]|nr:SAM-dependent methyltransferase [Candidatus Roizmanbacteria bacterium]
MNERHRNTANFSESAFAIQKAQANLIEDIDTVNEQRQLYELGVIVTDRYRKDVGNLVSNESEMLELETRIEAYQKKWHIPLVSTVASRPHAILDIIRRHPKTLQARSLVMVPIATLMDISNRSTFGIYIKGESPLNPETAIYNNEFITLTHSPYWRRLMGKHAVRMAERFGKTGIPFNLIMVGDGSGALGADMMKAVADQGANTHLYHIDIADSMIEKQRETYERAGIDPKRIRGVNADITNMQHSLQEFGVDTGFIVAHEVLDSLRTHSLLVGPHGVRELYQEISLEGQSLQAFLTEDPLLCDLVRFFPWLKHGEGKFLTPRGEKMVPFAPMWINALKEMTTMIKQGAIYVGDYHGQFALEAYNQLPTRVYGKAVEEQDRHNYLAVLDRTTDMTTDIPPSILYLSQRWGGKVEFIGTQSEFLSIVEPNLTSEIPQRLEQIRGHALKRQYKAGDAAKFIEDDLYVTQIAGTGLFGSLIVKGIA